MGKLFIVGIVLFFIGNEIGSQDVLGIGTALIVVAIAWSILKTFSGVGGSSGFSGGGNFSSDYWSSYNEYGGSGGGGYSDDYIEAVRQNDSRFR